MSIFEEFAKELNKSSEKRGDVVIRNNAPEFWLDSGNYVLNKITSGSYTKGWAQGRWGMFAGMSGVGKSFLIANAIKAAQDQDFGVFVLDSEHALDDGYLKKLDVDVDSPKFIYRGVNTIPSAQKEFSSFSSIFRKHGPEKMGRWLIVADSLDMLLTASELDKFESGEVTGDQGQHAKQIKALLNTWQQDIKNLPIVGLATKQAYMEQDRIKALSEPFVITESVKFAFSQIIMCNKLQLKDKEKNHIGITLQARCTKTRFTQPFQKVKIEVPYASGMDRFSGLLDVAISQGIIEKNGGWYTYGDTKFQESNFSKVRDEVLKKLIQSEEDAILDVEITEDFDNSDNLTRKDAVLESLSEFKKGK